MVDGLREAVVAAREEGASGLLLTASGDRAFCAGGDIRQVAAMPPQQRRDFLRREYSLMIELFALRDSVPVVALADGLIFGAGAGLFMAAETRIASAPSSLAMPECALGIVPDVGATDYLRSCLEGGIGQWASLTGGRFSSDAMAAGGLCTHV